MVHARKIMALLTAASFFATWIHPPLAVWAQDEEHRAFVAVLDLDVAKGIPPEAQISLSDLLREQLWKTGKFRVVDRNNMERILKEQGFQLSDCTSTECAVQIGRMLGVEKMVTGNVTRLGKTYIITVQMTNVETGEIEKMASDRCPGCEVDELLGSIDKAATSLAGVVLKVEKVEKAPPKPAPPKPGKLSIDSKPEDAKIYVNGRKSGSTPNLIAKLKPGTYEVRIRKSGYLEYVPEVTVDSGKTASINANLVEVAPKPEKEKPLVVEEELAPKKKKGKTGLIVGLVAAAVVLGVGGGLAIFFLSSGDEEGEGVSVTISGPLP